VVSVRTEAGRAELDLIRCCHSGLGVDVLQGRVLTLLRRLVSFDAAFFATADPQTLLFTAVYTEDPLDTAAQLLLDNELGASDVNTFASLATSHTMVASLDQATGGDRLASDRFRDIMRPLGLGDELRAALVVAGQCWGYLCLHRADHPLGFSEPEIALVGRLGPHIALGLRQALLINGSGKAAIAGTPGVVLLDDDLALVASTEQAQHLMALIVERRPTARELPFAVYSVAAALRAVEGGFAAPGSVPSTLVRAVTGEWLRLHASRLSGPSGERRIGVVVEPVEARVTAPLLLLAHGLSPREAQVATLVLRGAATTVIADTLHITGNTVQDHLKVVFDKVGVHSRRDLVGHILGQHAP
jgi:DNA-binding CsgD family transcriptional regulator